MHRQGRLFIKDTIKLPGILLHSEKSLMHPINECYLYLK